MKKNRKSVLTKILMTLAIVFTMTVVGGLNSKAALTAPTGLKQTYAYSTSFEVEWTGVANATGYRIQLTTDPTYSTWQYYEDWDASYTSLYVSNSDWAAIHAAGSYYVRVAAFDQKGVLGSYSAPIEVVTRPASATTAITHTASTTNSITVKWNPVSGANYYLVAYGKHGSDKVATKYTNNTSIKLTGLSKNSEYAVQVYAGRRTANGSVVAYEISGKYKTSIPVTPQAPSGVKVETFDDKHGEVDLRWKAQNSADGYQIQLYSENGKKKIKSVSKKTTVNWATIKHKELKKHKFYRVKVRTYCLNSSGKKYYSKWSSWIYTSESPNITKAQKTSKGLKINWRKVSGADRYVVYMSTKYNSGWTKVKTTGKNTATIAKLGKSKLKSGKTYYVKIVAQNKVGKKYYSGDKTWYTPIRYR